MGRKNRKSKVGKQHAEDKQAENKKDERLVNPKNIELYAYAPDCLEYRNVYMETYYRVNIFIL